MKEMVSEEKKKLGTAFGIKIVRLSSHSNID